MSEKTVFGMKSEGLTVEFENLGWPLKVLSYFETNLDQRFRRGPRVFNKLQVPFRDFLKVGLQGTCTCLVVLQLGLQVTYRLVFRLEGIGKRLKLLDGSISHECTDHNLLNLFFWNSRFLAAISGSFSLCFLRTLQNVR